MIILIHGEESFIVEATLRHLREQIPAEMRQLNIERVQDKKLSLDRLRQILLTVPFLGDQRLVVIEELISSMDVEPEALTDLLAQVPDSTVAVLIEAKPDRRKKLTKALFNAADKTVEAVPYREAELTQWLLKHAAERELKLSGSLANLLIAQVGEDMGRLHQEVEKLSLYTAGREPMPEDVKRLSAPEFDDRVFALTDALGDAMIPKALNLLQHNLAHGLHPLQLLSLIATHYRRLLYARLLLDERADPKQGLVKQLKVHPFPAEKIARQARRWKLSELRQRYHSCKLADGAIKKGQISADLALTCLVTGESLAELS